MLKKPYHVVISSKEKLKFEKHTCQNVVAMETSSHVGGDI